MDDDKFPEIYKGKDGIIVANIEKAENCNFQVWDEINKSPTGEYQDLAEARAEAKMIVIRYDQDQENR